LSFFVSKVTHIKDRSLQKVTITILPTQGVLRQENKANLKKRKFKSFICQS
jgi:hypothetical protein